MKDKPNVIFITSDECKASAVGCYGNKDAHTPNMDRLASESTMFSNAFTTMPKCVPSRCAMITGRYTHVEGHRTLPGFRLREGENNLVLELKKRGYRTGLFGKNHLVEPEILEDLFDEYTKGSKGVHGREFRNREPKDEHDANLLRGMYVNKEVDGEDLHDRYVVDDACRFIRENKENPFLLLLDIGNPHPVYKDIKPYIDIIRSKNIKLPKFEELDKAPEVLKAYRKTYNLEMLADDDWRKIVEAYYSMVSYADDLLGRVIDVVDKEGLKDNTIFIFTSDHGDFAGEHGTVEKYDTMFYDCLVKIPLMIRYPKKINPGVKVNGMVENIDIPPTILELCGFEVPKWMHGKSLVAAMDGRDKVHKEMVFSEGGVEPHAIDVALPYTSDHYKKNPNYYCKQRTMIDYPFTMYRSKMVRTKKWKLVFRVNGMKELYDLENDPMELNNVSGDPKNQTVINELVEKLLIWAIETETDYPPVIDMRA